VCLGYCYSAPAALDDGAPCAGANLADQLLHRTPRSDPAIPVFCDSPVPVITAGLLHEENPWAVWPRTAASADPTAVLDKVERSRHRGPGEGFSTALKWRTALAGHARRTVHARGDEVEPGSYVGRMLMELDPHRLLEGLALACFAVGAEEGVVLVGSEYPTARRRLEEAVEAAYGAGHLGRDIRGSGFDLEVRVAESASERPTLIEYVETLAAVPWIVRHGGDTFTRMGTTEETGTLVVSLSEGFTRPGAYEVQCGVSVRHVVQVLGKGLREGLALRALQVGGPLGGFLGPDDLDLPLSTAGLRSCDVSLGHAGIVALDDRVPGEELLRDLWSFMADEACDQCSTAARRALDLALRPDAPGASSARAEVLQSLCGGSRCALGRRAPAAVRSLVRVYGLG
jgi:NADH-quinone oxidoreductase subunit F